MIRKFKIILLLSMSVFYASAQNALQPVDSLINKTNAAWPIIQQWLNTAKNKVEVLEADPEVARTALYQAQVNTFSTLGSVIYHTGGILVDNGWIRILGSGNPKLNRSIAQWNKGKTINAYGDQPGYLLVADDAVGGFFAINYGELGTDLKNVYYLAPNSLHWEPLGAGYSEFILFCFDSDLSKFYGGLRWKTWDQFISNLDGNKVYSFKPYLWSEEGTDIDKCSRKITDIETLYHFNIEKQQEINAKPKN